MKHLISLLFIFCVVSATAQENEYPDRIHRMLDKHFDLLPSEAIFVQTDRDVYRAGEIVWFSAFVSNPSVVGLGSVSDNLIVALYDSEGEKINEDKYKMVGGLCNGDFNLPKDAEAGRYVLIAYSGATVKANELFMKTTYVDEFNRNKLIVKVENSQLVLVAGKENELVFVASDPEGKPFNGKLNFEVKDGEDEVVQGKVKAEEDGALRVKFDLPAQAFDVPLELILTDGKLEVYKSPYQVDTEKVQVDFGAEGGQLVAGVMQKVAFRVENSLGQEVEVGASLIAKSSGEQILQAKTMVPGFGFFPLTARAGERYQLKITKGPGTGQVFDLPEVAEDAVTLTLTRTDDQFIYCNLQAVGASSKKLHLIAFCGSQLVWGTDVVVEDVLSLKIPKDNFPNGLCQLLVLDDKLNRLAGRLVFVDKGEPLDIDAELNSPVIDVNTTDNLKVRVNSNSKSEQTTLLNVSISPSVLVVGCQSDFEVSLKINSLLAYPQSGLCNMADEGKLSEAGVNYLLIGNQLKNGDWDAIKTSQSKAKLAEGIMRAGLEEQIPGRVQRFVNTHSSDQKPDFTPEFVLANEDLFQRVRPKSLAADKSEQYKKFLQSGSSILDVIKMIKPYSMDGDKIIFPGGTNSLLYQDGALIVIDGQKMGTSAGVLSSISPNDIESIDISTRPIDIQQYTGLNSVGLIDIKTKKGERIVETNDEPIKQYDGGNRVPRVFVDEVPAMAENEKQLTLFWDPFAAANPTYEKEIPGTKTVGRYLIRILAVDDEGNMVTKQIPLTVK